MVWHSTLTDLIFDDIPKPVRRKDDKLEHPAAPDTTPTVPAAYPGRGAGGG